MRTQRGLESYSGNCLVLPSDISAKVTETRSIFEALVWPLWRHEMGAIELRNVEGSDTALDRRLDLGGVDAFFARQKSGILIPIASRIEFGRSERTENSSKIVPSFTIRRSTNRSGGWSDDCEFSRLMDAYNDPISKRFLPLRTFQSFVSFDRKRLIFSSSVCTWDLCSYLENQNRSVGFEDRKTIEGDARFVRIAVESLKNAGLDAKTLWV